MTKATLTLAALQAAAAFIKGEVNLAGANKMLKEKEPDAPPLKGPEPRQQRRARERAEAKARRRRMIGS